MRGGVGNKGYRINRNYLVQTSGPFVVSLYSDVLMFLLHVSPENIRGITKSLVEWNCKLSKLFFSNRF